MNKITIIGTGSVGSTIAYTLAINGLASEIVMIDINEEKARGEALDIFQGTPFCYPCSIYAGSYADAAESDIVVITSGVARKPGQSRLDLAQTNVNIIKSIAPEITRYAPDANYIIVSNPVDVLTYTFCKVSGIPESRVMGSGTTIDTARLRAKLADDYCINQQNIHAYVLGEHGDSSFVPWSAANISNIPVEQFAAAVLEKDKNYPEFNGDEIVEYVRTSGARVIKDKGATFYAIAMSVCHICKCLLSGIDTALTVSTMMHGEYGVDDVCLSVLTLVGKNGAHSKVMLPLNDEEVAALQKSAESLKEIINSVTL